MQLSSQAVQPSEPSPLSTVRSRWATLVIGVCLSAMVAILAFQGVNLAESWQRIRAGWAPGLMLAAVMTLGVLWLRALRWRCLLKPHRIVRLRSCFSGVCVGYMANNILPFRLGDLVRGGVLARLDKADGATVLGTVAVERLVDSLTLVLFLAVFLALGGGAESSRALLFAGQMALVGCVFLTLILLMGYRRRQTIERWCAAPFSWFSPNLAGRVSMLTGRFLEGLQVFTSGKQLLQIAGLSCVMWGSSVVLYHVVGTSLGLHLPLADYVVVVFTTAFGALIPAAPGALGTFHGFARLGLYLMAVRNAEAAVAFAITLHALEWTVINLAGLFFLWRDRLSLLTSLRSPGETHATPPIAEARPEPASYAQPV